MIGCWCDGAFVEKIDRARGQHTRSQFCREAIAEKLRAEGFQVADQEIASPNRAGKGGPRRTVYPLAPGGAALNETSSPAAQPAKKNAVKSRPG